MGHIFTDSIRKFLHLHNLCREHLVLTLALCHGSPIDTMVQRLGNKGQDNELKKIAKTPYAVRQMVAQEVICSNVFT